MSKNIIICYDGTGNEYGKNNTNVVKTFESIVRDEKQVAFYDPGVGTFSYLGRNLGKGVGKILGLAFGAGLQQNLEDGYEYLMNRFEKDDKVFFGGDFETGEGTVVHAIASGKRGAFAIMGKMGVLNRDETDESLRVADETPSRRIISYDQLNTFYFRKEKRLEPKRLDAGKRVKDFLEIVAQASQDAVMAESGRCFSCGTCTLCGVCWYFCPDASVVVSEKGPQKVVFDLDFCKGCAICSVSCPRGCIVMEEEQ